MAKGRCEDVHTPVSVLLKSRAAGWFGIPCLTLLDSSRLEAVSRETRSALASSDAPWLDLWCRELPGFAIVGWLRKEIGVKKLKELVFSLRMVEVPRQPCPYLIRLSEATSAQTLASAANFATGQMSKHFASGGKVAQTFVGEFVFPSLASAQVMGAQVGMTCVSSPVIVVLPSPAGGRQSSMEIKLQWCRVSQHDSLRLVATAEGWHEHVVCVDVRAVSEDITLRKSFMTRPTPTGCSQGSGLCSLDGPSREVLVPAGAVVPAPKALRNGLLCVVFISDSPPSLRQNPPLLWQTLNLDKVTSRGAVL